MSGRIESARNEIATRLEKLRIIPGLHTEERQAISDALSGLRVLLTNEEARYDATQQRLALERTVEQLRSVAPAILKAESDTTG